MDGLPVFTQLLLHWGPSQTGLFMGLGGYSIDRSSCGWVCAAAGCWGWPPGLHRAAGSICLAACRGSMRVLPVSPPVPLWLQSAWRWCL